MGIKSIIDNPFPVLREPLDLGLFHEDLRGNTIEIWVNPSDELYRGWREFHDRIGQLKADEIKTLPDDVLAERDRLWSELWGIPPDDVGALFGRRAADNLIAWMCDQTWARINSYARRRKKAASG